MLLLDEGYWSASSCIERGAWNFLIAIAFIIAITAAGMLKSRFQHGIRISGAEIASEGKLTFYSLLCLVLMVVICISAVNAVARSRTVLFVENGSLVERGCIRLSAYEDRFPMEGMKARYQSKSEKNDNNHFLLLQPNPTSRTLSVAISDSPHLINLQRIAPDVIDTYVRNLKEHGVRVPAILENQ